MSNGYERKEKTKKKPKYVNSSNPTNPKLVTSAMSSYVKKAQPVKGIDMTAINMIAAAFNSAFSNFKDKCTISWTGTTTIATLVPVVHPMAGVQRGKIITPTIITPTDILSCTKCTIDDKGNPSKHVIIELFKMLGQKLAVPQQVMICIGNVQYVSIPQTFSWPTAQLNFATAGIHCQQAMSKAWTTDDDIEKIDKLKFFSIIDKYLVEALSGLTATFPVVGPAPTEGPATFTGTGTLTPVAIYKGKY